MNKQNLDYIFQPKSIAVVGVSSKQTTMPNLGQRYLEAVLDYGFKGKVYPVNSKGGEFRGLKIYPNIKDIPEPIDYVISCIPASVVPQLIKDCAASEVKAIQVYTSGFSEFGTEEGKQLEKEISSLARQNGIRILGPNCLGGYYPKAGLSYCADFPKESGSVALICQSGANSVYLVREATKRGVRFSKVVSYGNAADIDEGNLLEYLATDPDTEIIIAYIEGVKNGKRFSQILKETAGVKPVIVLKGGISESGATAAASHTGALSGSNGVWDGLLRQVGAIRAYSLEELVDMAVTFSYLPPLSGNKVVILGLGGGASVLAADDCTSAGLIVPRFPEELRGRFGNLFEDEAGMMLNNPIDLATGALEIGLYSALTILGDYEEIDFSIVHFPLGGLRFPPSSFPRSFDSLTEDVVKAHGELAKPMIVVIHFPTSKEDYEWMLEAQRKCYEAGIATYHSISNASKAVARFLRYHEHKLAGGQN